MKPLLVLPTTLYELVRDRCPTALLEERGGVVQLIGLQTQCGFMNRLADECQRWKAPAARGLEDQLETIQEFHPALEEAVIAVIERSDRLLATLEAAGKHVGGLALDKVSEQDGSVSS